MLYSHFFYKKWISIGTHPLENRIAKASVLNMYNHITVIEIATGDQWKRVRNLKRTVERVLRFIGKKKDMKKTNVFMEIAKRS